MFQSFEVKSTPLHGKPRIAAIRGLFGELGIDGVLVPRSDEYLGEYVPESAERLAWATGFTGSAGMLMVTETLAVVFVDGRYVTQLAQQVDPAVFTPGDLVGEPPHKWIENRAPKGFRLGIDPWMHTGAEVRRLEKALADPRRKALACFTVDEPDIVLVGRETILRNGEPVGYLTSGGYGYTVGKSIGYGYVRNADGVTDNFLTSGDYELVVAMKRIPAQIHLGPLYDPGMAKVKA
mgnify:CR=1 FL=1